MAMTPANPDRLPASVAATLRKHWGLFLAEGIVLVILGLAAIVIPPLATFAVAILVGWLFLLSGVIGLITTFWMRGAPGFLWSLLSAAIGIVAGILLLWSPVTGAISLTAVLVVFFVMEGVASIMYALDHRRDLPATWGWMLVSGVVDLVLAAFIFAGLPASAAWAIGLLVGINMVFGGTALIAMALRARTSRRRNLIAVPPCRRSGDLLLEVAEHDMPRLVVHLGLELVLVLERDGARSGRPRRDLIDETLEVRELRPRRFAEHVRHQPRPAPDVHVDDRVGVADHVALLGEARIDDAEMALRLVGVAIDRVGYLLRGVVAEVHRLAGIRPDTGRHEHQP